MRCFNIEGKCYPEDHYMVDVTKKTAKICELVSKGKYFTINRARQYGKTNMLEKLCSILQPQYYVISLSFEGIGSDSFTDDKVFVSNFESMISKYIKENHFPKKMISAWDGPINSLSEVLRSIKMRLTNRTPDSPFRELREGIIRFCGAADKPVVLMIDEVDRASNNQVFLDFLGMLRDNYLQKKTEASFRSVILAGVTDIRNMKMKIRPESQHTLNSPWNIAAEFNVDMSFSAEEIAGMLEDYEADHGTGMDIMAVSQEIRRLTSGYPYLVSWLCMQLDASEGMNWTIDGVQAAGRAFVKCECTLLDDLQKNIENNAELKDVLINILYYDAKYTLKPYRIPIQIGVMYGYLKDSGENYAQVANLLFESYLYEYSVAVMRDSLMGKLPEDRSQFIRGGRLDVVQVLDRFQAFLASEYREEDGTFLEKHGRLLFLCFLKPIINGTGYYYVEPQTRSNKRMDIVVSYGTEEHIVELKIWDGPKYREDGIRQLENYMESREAKEGYLISFNFQKTDRTQHNWLSPQETSMQIYEVIIQCSANENSDQT